MPEGHTIHALAARLDRTFAGHPVHASSPQGRFAAGAALLDGQLLRGSQAWGKHLFCEFGADRWLHVHLGLIGLFAVLPLPEQLHGVDPDQVPVTGAVRLRLLNNTHVADLRGPMTCALRTPEEIAAVEATLGPDPLRPDADPHTGWERVRRSRRPVAELLMDQQVLAGVGNVYRCEVLFRHRVDPHRPGREMRESTWMSLWQDLVKLMPLGVAFGQILTMDDQVADARAAIAAGGVAEYTASLTGQRLGERFERRFFVYRRTGEPCLQCGARVRSAPLAGRTLYWCGRCQRRR